MRVIKGCTNKQVSGAITTSAPGLAVAAPQNNWNSATTMASSAALRTGERQGDNGSADAIAQYQSKPFALVVAGTVAGRSAHRRDLGLDLCRRSCLCRRFGTRFWLLGV